MGKGWVETYSVKMVGAVVKSNGKATKERNWGESNRHRDREKEPNLPFPSYRYTVVRKRRGRDESKSIGQTGEGRSVKFRSGKARNKKIKWKSGEGNLGGKEGRRAQEFEQNGGLTPKSGTRRGSLWRRRGGAGRRVSISSSWVGDTSLGMN